MNVYTHSRLDAGEMQIIGADGKPLGFAVLAQGHDAEVKNLAGFFTAQIDDLEFAIILVNGSVAGYFSDEPIPSERLYALKHPDANVWWAGCAKQPHLPCQALRSNVTILDNNLRPVVLPGAWLTTPVMDALQAQGVESIQAIQPDWSLAKVLIPA